MRTPDDARWIEGLVAKGSVPYHPSALGHEAMAQLVLDALASAVPSRRRAVVPLPSFIPVDVADISAAWLQEVLQPYAPGADRRHRDRRGAPERLVARASS